MTDLTEQWKKGELELDKNYYIELEDGTIEIQMFVGGFLCKEDNGVKEVLAPVPSYEEYERLNWYAGNGVEENIKLKSDCKTLIQKLLQVKPELREWLEVNFKEYL